MRLPHHPLKRPACQLAAAKEKSIAKRIQENIARAFGQRAGCTFGHAFKATGCNLAPDLSVCIHLLGVPIHKLVNNAFLWRSGGGNDRWRASPWRRLAQRLAVALPLRLNLAGAQQNIGLNALANSARNDHGLVGESALRCSPKPLGCFLKGRR